MKSVVALVFALALGAATQTRAQPVPDIGAAYVPHELLVRLAAGRSLDTLLGVLDTLGGAVATPLEGVDGLYLVYLPTALDVAGAKRVAQALDGVAYAEPNYVLSTGAVPDDPSFSFLWGLHNTGQTGGSADADIDAPEAWNLTTGSSDVVVAVIDTGVAHTHPDLAANMFRNEADCNTNGVDDDSNGYVDDCHGIDTINNDSDPMDDHRHGTHVAGTIGAAGNNGIGVAGVSWQVKMLACKFLGNNGIGFTSGAITCLNYIAAMKDRGVNIIATNNSWSGGDFSQALLDAIEAQRQRGILFIAAAGNSNADNDVTASYPSRYEAPNVVAVASTTSSDLRSSFSNYGRRTVHLGAPGSEIYSTVLDGGYGTISGTSMATPHVTGVAALLEAQDPGRDWRAIRNLLLAGGDPVGAMNGVTITGRRLNAFGALQCNNQTVLARVAPVPDIVITSVGGAVTLAALHINCAAGAGNVTVSVAPGSATVTLTDDGSGVDQAAGDGRYSGTFVPPSVGSFQLTFAGSTLTVKVLSSTAYAVQTAANGYRQISGTNLGLDDDNSAAVSPPFPVHFGALTFNTLYVSSNGVINFNGLNNAYLNGGLPTTTFTTLVAPFWDDLRAGVDSDSVVSWAVSGTAPERELVVEWKNMVNYTCYSVVANPAVAVTFQVVFFEGSNDILFNYPDVIFGGNCPTFDRGASATVGVQSLPAVATPFSVNAASLSDGVSLLWTLSGAPGTFTDTPLVAGVTPVRALHVSELRARIDLLRTRFGLAAAAWTDPSLVPGVTVVRAQHLSEIQATLAETYVAAGRASPAFSGSPQAGSTMITTSQIVELRAAIIALEKP